jgi:hypothetical protein
MSATRSLTTALVIAAAVTAPAASAAPASDPINVSPQPVQVVQSPTADSGFDWGDAGIGAGGAIAVGLLSLGAVVTVRRHDMSPAS